MNSETTGKIRGLRGHWIKQALLVSASAGALQALAGPALAQINVPNGDAPVATAPASKGNAAVNDSASAAATAAPKEPGTSVSSEVVVTGIRGSLQRDLNIKRNSYGIVDAISAEDIGKFPDNNVAEAIQRIPGVSVSRGASSLGGVPTSTGDATEITVRGFGPQFNETLYDDRQISTGTSNRGFDFSSVGADFVGEVDVLKTPDATLSAGAIGATINIKYPKPFDHPGLRLVGSASTDYSPEDGHAAPNGGILFSNTFLDNKVGLLVDVAYQDHKTEANHINNQGWEGTTGIAPSQLAAGSAGYGSSGPLNSWYIQDYGLYQEHTNTSREDARMVLQWRPQSNILVTLNDDYNIERVTQDQNGYSVWFSPGSLQNVVRDGNGTVTSFTQPGSPSDFQSQINKEVLENNEYGINAKWDVSNDFTVDFDADRAISWLNPNGQLSEIDTDVGYGGTNASTIGVKLGNGNGNLPVIFGSGPAGAAGAYNNGVIGSHVLPITSAQNKDTVNQFKIQGNWHNQDTQIRFGVQYVSDHDHLNEYDDFQNNDWQAYSGYGPASGSTTGIALPQSLFTNGFSTSGFIPGYNNAGLPSSILKYSPYKVLNYLQGLGNPKTTAIPGFNYASVPAYAGMYQIVEHPPSFAQISNDIYSGFLTYSHKTELYNMPLQVNFGLREELTHSVSAGLTQLPASLTQQSGDPTAFLINYATATPSFDRVGNFYSYLLPNIDLGLNVTPQIKVRVDASRTLTRPTLSDLSPDVSITAQRVNSLAASSGNPLLQPYLSDNGDIGVEWYYQRNSYISVDGFVKHVTNFVIANSKQTTINNSTQTLTTPTSGVPVGTTTAEYTLSSYVNGPAATIRGIELAIQHTFWDTGFGFQANATAVASDHPYDPENLTVSNFAVTGLADSANFVAFYDKNGFQARVAANWRDSYLDHFGQQQNGSAFGTEPTFVDANWTVDFSTSLDVTKQLSVYFEANNLTDSGYATRGRFSNQYLDIISYGRRFTLGAHFRY